MILQGDCLDVLRTLPPNSVHCVVTSPPYWSLRDYGVPPSVWGGTADCAHVWASAGTREGYGAKKKWQHSMTNAVATNGRGEPREGDKRARKREDGGWVQVEQGEFCEACGAWRGCLGLEPTPDLYVAHIVTVFEEVRRVLRKDGTCWLNLGDSYAQSGGDGSSQGPNSQRAGRANLDAQAKAGTQRPPIGLKPKDLCMIPARVAIALQASGWYLRSDIVWSKTNPMPESTRDRPTKSHEYVFLLSKTEHYFYDADAIREGVTGNSHPRGGGVHPKAVERIGRGSRIKSNQSFSAAVSSLVGSRNRRSVWTLPTAPYKGAHFATFPPRLIEPCILAGTSEHGCCSVCGAPYKRIVKLGAPLVDQQKASGADTRGEYHGKATKAYAGAGAQDPSATKARILEGMRERITIGWHRTCRHTLAAIDPCVVLDPFGGTGTTGMVAAKHGRDFILIELSPANIALTEERLEPTRAEASAS